MRIPHMWTLSPRAASNGQRGALWVVACGLMLSGCTTGAIEVTQHGAMRAVMREGQTEPRIRLADAVSRPHAYAVGALEGLSGEVTIVDGEVWVSRVATTGVEVTGPQVEPNDQATLLTLSHVDRWHTVTIDQPAGGAALESIIAQAARSLGVDATRPFPFIVEGETISVDLHVINGYCPVATDPATIDAQPWNWSSPAPGPVALVGFYAPDAAGVMTHHGTSLHMHAVIENDGQTIAGHADAATVGPGAILRLPANQ